MMASSLETATIRIVSDGGGPASFDGVVIKRVHGEPLPALLYWPVDIARHDGSFDPELLSRASLAPGKAA